MKKERCSNGISPFLHQNLRRMKLTIGLIIFTVLGTMAADLYSQTAKLSLDYRDESIINLLCRIEEQSKFRFFFNEEVKLDFNVSVNVIDASIDQVLNRIFENSDINYKIIGRQIVLTNKAFSIPSDQTLTIKGKVIDSSGIPLPGVTVLVKGTTQGITTDADGNYTFSKVPSDATLVFSFVGMKTQEVLVGDQTSINVTMTEDTQAVDEVIVIGYGTTKRKDFTGSASSVKLENSPIALAANMNALETLKGNVSGLDIGYTNTAGGTPSMQIRGQNSISGSNDPLVVVDGIIFLGNINDINPNDIASVDILKDATSAAAYGSRSANGVIMITTKKGKNGKPVIHFNMSGSGQTWHLKPKLMNGEQWLDAVATANGYPDYSFLTSQEELNHQTGKEIHWLDETSRTGLIQDYQAAVSGAGEKMNYYLSTAYTNNKGVIKGDDFDRISALAKINTDITNWLQIGLEAAYAHLDYSGVSANIRAATMLSPYGMMFRPNGLPEATPDGTRGHGNPLWGVDDQSKKENIDYQDNLRVNAFARVKLPWIPGLSYRFNYAGNLNYRKAGDFTHESNYAPNGDYDDDSRYSSETQNSYLSSANGNITNEKTKSYVIDNILNYNGTFGKHTIDLTAVATRDYKKYEYQNLSGSDFAANGNTTLGLNGLHYASTQKITLDNWKLTNAGYFGRASWSFDDKYYFTASYRRDGASVFGANKKWGNFGAIGAAWRMTNESFMQKLEFLNDLKIKLSWGKNGNQGLKQYSTLSKVGNGQSGGIYYTFGNSGKPSYGIDQSSIGNADLGWETTKAWNTGFESAWLNSRLFVDVDIYFSKTDNQIFLRTIPAMTGFSSMYSSMGAVRNKGFEATVRNINIQHKEWKWSTGITFWLNRNKLIHLYGEDLNSDGKEDDDIGNGLFINESIHSIYGYKQKGIVQTSDTEYMQANGVSAGTPKYADKTGEGVIDAEDRSVIGSTDPNFKLNLSNTLQYKDFELYIMIAGVFGGNGYFQKSNINAYITCGDRSQFASNGLFIPYWTESHPGNKYPAATFTGDSYFLGLQSRAYMRLQDITLSYTFNQPWVKNTGIDKLKLFITGKNLATITNWKGGDPESGSTALDGTFPVMTSISLGLNLSF